MQVIFLCNVVSDVFGQHWLNNIPMECCPSMVDTTLYGLFSLKKLSFSYGKTLHRWFPRAMLAKTGRDNIIDLFVGCGPKCTSNFLVQCWLRQIKTTLYKVIFQRIDNYVVWANIPLVIFLCNVVSDVSGQQWVCNIHMQCCPSLIDTTLYRLFYSEKLSVNHGSTLHR